MAVECPRKIAYAGKPSYNDASGHNAFLKSLAASGFQVGALAKRLFPDGVDLDGLLPQPALAQTAEALRSNAVTIFEPAFAYGQFLIRCDILI